VNQDHRGRRILTQDTFQEPKLLFSSCESGGVAGLGLRDEPICYLALLLPAIGRPTTPSPKDLSVRK
jgi:hypothetical protein